jgi:hypothetical protein
MTTMATRRRTRPPSPHPAQRSSATPSFDEESTARVAKALMEEDEGETAWPVCLHVAQAYMHLVSTCSQTWKATIGGNATPGRLIDQRCHAVLVAGRQFLRAARLLMLFRHLVRRDQAPKAPARVAAVPSKRHVWAGLPADPVKKMLVADLPERGLSLDEVIRRVIEVIYSAAAALPSTFDVSGRVCEVTSRARAMRALAEAAAELRRRPNLSLDSGVHMPLVDALPRHRAADLCKDAPKPKNGETVSVRTTIAGPDGAHLEVRVRAVIDRIVRGRHSWAIVCGSCSRPARIVYVLPTSGEVMCWRCRGATHAGDTFGTSRAFRSLVVPLVRAERLRRRALRTRNLDRRNELMEKAREMVQAATDVARRAAD